MNKVQVITTDGIEQRAQLIEAAEIGGCDGDLILFDKDNKVVAIFARDTWVSAAFVSALAGGLPS